MINQLSYRISFPSTGKAFSQKLDFAPGLTIIRGPNEIGKSLILEMIRYALFGVSALRGTREDYEELTVNLTFTVKGEDYRVARNGNKAFLNGKLAVGTAAVNKKIIEILGFDLDVFDMACAAMQGDLDKLTKRMRPGERRKMVEEVIGLDNIEEEEKLCRSEANALKRELSGQESRLVEPQPPETPDNYESSDILEELYHKQVEVEAERVQLLRMKEPLAPVKPKKPEYSDDVEEYEANRKTSEAEREGIRSSLQRIPVAVRTRQDTLRALDYYEQQRLGPKPRFEEEQLRTWQQEWGIIGSVGTLLECPNCGSSFDPTTKSIHTLPQEPELPLREIERELVAHERWRDYDKEIIESTDLTEEEANEQSLALSQESYRNELLDALSAIPDLPSRAEEAERRRVYLNELEVYERLAGNFKSLQATWNESRQRLEELPDPDPTLAARIKESRAYEEQMRRYDAEMISYMEAKHSIEATSTKIEGYLRGAEALKDVRLEAKQHLVPSLNRVASHLLSEMSDGKRNKIKVDEEFEVVVDGQPVRTLSGSGISVVNLALRVALGQVLTQKIVPLFLADEIDHDMDPERAQATHDSLRKLTKVLDKVIVVTHKSIDGDQTIHLE